MTQAANDNIVTAFRVVDLISFENEPCVPDELLGERLGMAQPRDLRSKIKANLPELAMHGKLHTAPILTTAKGGRPGIAYYLNEAQALLLCMFANTKIAASVRKMLIDVFMEYRRGNLPTQQPDLVAPIRETAIAVTNSIAKMADAVSEMHKIADSLSPKYLSAMVVGGRPIVVDVSDFNLADGEEAVVVKWNGEVAIEPVSFLKGRHMFAGERSAHGPVIQNGVGTCREGVVVLGKVLKGQPHAAHEVVAAQVALPEPKPCVRKRRKPMDYKTYQRMFALWTSGYSNAEIARELEVPYQMVQKRTARVHPGMRSLRLAVA